MKYIILSCTWLAAFALVGCGGRQLIQIPSSSTPEGAMPSVAGSGGAVVDSEGANVHVASIPGFPSYAETQPNDADWCWAACATMIHNYFGNSTTIEEVVRRVKGTERNKHSAMIRGVMIALYPEYARHLAQHATDSAVSQHSKGGIGGVTIQADDTIESWGRAFTQTSDHLVLAISKGEPVVIGLKHESLDPEGVAQDSFDGSVSGGHAYAVFEVKYSVENENALLGMLNSAKNLVMTERHLLPIDPESVDLEGYARLFSVHGVRAMDPLTGQSKWISGQALQDQFAFLLTCDVAERTLRSEYEALRLQN